MVHFHKHLLAWAIDLLKKHEEYKAVTVQVDVDP
jgi:hypothetical protein